MAKNYRSKSRTAGQHSFAQVPRADIQRSAFNRSCGVKTTFDAGLLVPIFADEALPGDTMSLRLATFARLSTPIHPIMDNMMLDTFFFAVPIRLLWDNWQKFNGEQTDPGDSVDFTVPDMMAPGPGGYDPQELSDYLGIPTSVPGLVHSSLWHRAYNLIWNEWFRDQNLQDSAVHYTGDTRDLIADYPMRRRGKRHDYFTSCLPWPQKGAAVTMDLGTSAPLVFPNQTGDRINVEPHSTAPAPLFDVGDKSGVGLAAAFSGAVNTDWDQSIGTAGTDPAEFTTTGMQVDAVGAYADLSMATAATINSLRQAFQIQKLLERDARGGTRYTEIIRAHFGVSSPDQRLQRPEYLGGGSSPITVSAVPQTSSTDGTSPQGNLAAFGVSSSSGQGFVKSFVEHCVILGLVSARADLNYQQGLARQFQRVTKYDFYWPALAHLGEQAVLNREIYAQGQNDYVKDAEVFGYQERFAEYRYKPSLITGLFRSNASGSLDTWHLAQDFATLPLLDDTFIQENPPIDRVIAAPTEPHFIFDAFFSFKHARPMPTYSVPGLIDHF